MYVVLVLERYYWARSWARGSYSPAGLAHTDYYRIRIYVLLYIHQRCLSSVVESNLDKKGCHTERRVRSPNLVPSRPVIYLNNTHEHIYFVLLVL